MGSDIIKISHLTKNFGDVIAVNDLNFKVKRGELFAFLGVNGAGKSTTISIICGQLHKDSGSVELDGIASEKLGNELGKKQEIIFQGQRNVFFCAYNTIYFNCVVCNIFSKGI